VSHSQVLDRARSFIACNQVLVVALALYLPLVFFGYGSDVDTFRVLDAGRGFFASTDYVPSRRPGYLVYEMAAFGLDRLGGSRLANLGSVFWALAAVASFQRICRRHRVKNAGLLTLALALHPVFWYNATVTLDYMWALGMLLVGFDLLEQEHFGWAGLALGLAVGCRLSSVIFAAGLFGYAWLRTPRGRLRLAGAAALAVLLACVAYIPPWDFAEWRASFWTVSAGSPALWSPLMQVGRFAYKNLYFWGVPAGVFLLCLPFFARPGRCSLRGKDESLFAGLALLVLLGSEVLFFRYPIEVEYLLPALPFWLLLIGQVVPSKKTLSIFLILVVSFNVVSINLARPDVAGQASSARAGVWIEPGYLVQEMRARLALMGCDSHACYDERVAPRPGALPPGE
jgi:hypothetical protein